MNVAANCHWTRNRLHIRLLQEDFLGFFAEDAKILLVQALCLLQISNTLVDIHPNSNILKFYLNINYKSKTIARLNAPQPQPSRTLSTRHSSRY
jgi:hypothetical protein